jgi:hypothetical protein
MWPWLPLLGLYAHWGWLNPDHWSFDAESDAQNLSNTPGATSPRGPGAASATGHTGNMGKGQRNPPRPDAPWPDEPALRQQLAWRDLRTLSFKTGTQRPGTTEVRLDLQWSGPLAEDLDMLHSLGLTWPQMRLDTLTLQMQALGDWKVEWRGWWRLMAVPKPLPAAPIGLADLKHWAAHPVFNARAFQSHQAALWRSTPGGRHLLPWLRPDQLEWVAYVPGPPAQAWVHWQQHTVAIAVGDRIGGQGAVVRAIGAREITIAQGAVLYRLQPRTLTPLGIPATDSASPMPRPTSAFPP